MTEFYSRIKDKITESQDKIELTLDWMKNKMELNPQDRALKAGWSLVDDAQSELTYLYLDLDRSEAQYHEMMKTAQERQEEDARKLLELLGGRSIYVSSGETDLLKYLTDTIAPYTEESEETKKTQVQSYLLDLVISDLQAYHKGQSNVIANWLDPELVGKFVTEEA
jgi:hypothetical protein